MSDPLAWSGPRREILRALATADAPLWAGDLADALGIKFGTVYHTFRRLYDLAWVVGITVPNPGTPARVCYRLTALGCKETESLR